MADGISTTLSAKLYTRADRPSAPLVTLKWAQTLDGRIATRTGHSRWISGTESRAAAHRLRAQHDALLVGIGTVLADDPELNVRLADGRDPIRVVLDTRGRLPLSARVLRGTPENVLVACTANSDPLWRRALRDMGCGVAELARGPGGVDLRLLLLELSARGMRSVLIEGGSRVLTEAFRQGIGDRVVVFVAPKIAGAGIQAVADLGITAMAHALSLDGLQIKPSGCDIAVTATLGYH